MGQRALAQRPGTVADPRYSSNLRDGEQYRHDRASEIAAENVGEGGRG